MIFYNLIVSNENNNNNKYKIITYIYLKNNFLEIIFLFINI